MAVHKRILYFFFFFPRIFLLIIVIFVFSPKIAFAAMSLTFSNAPSTIDEETPFEVDVSLIGAPANQTYYLRAVFHKEGKTQYFGYTFNHEDNWHKSSSEYTKFLKIITDETKSWSGKLKTKADVSDSAFKGTGDYSFKIGRYTENGSLSWHNNSVTITINVQPTSTPTLTPTSSLIPTQVLTNTPIPTNTPSLSIATYEINEVKDDDGNVLSSVKIYVDDHYIHHYASEELTFCDNCYCDDDREVACGFGEHNFRLEKSGYNDWSETKTINAGDNFEVNPVMGEESSEPASTSTPVPTSTPKPTVKPTAKKTIKPTPTKKKKDSLEEELSTESAEATIAGEATKSAESVASATATPSKLGKVLGGGLFLLGGLSILGAGAFLLKKKYFKKGVIKLPL